jgi:CheY-like chemotaxis protein
MSLQGRTGDVSNGQRVLVVDDVSDTEEVLRAVLEPRGVHVDRVRSARFALPDASTPTTPAVVVIDMEPSPVSGANDDRTASWDNVPQVIIGSIKLPHRTGPHAERHYLAKPFEYAELIRAIEKFIR